jgi:hypothetical protein
MKLHFGNRTIIGIGLVLCVIGAIAIAFVLRQVGMPS